MWWSVRQSERRTRSCSRFWGVHRGGGVADVLGALEHPERQTGQEVSGREQTCHRTQREARTLWERERENKKMVDGLVCSLNISSARRLFRPYLWGSVTRPPAGECCLDCTHNAFPAGGRPRGIRCRRGRRTSPSAWSRLPSWSER